MSHGHIFPCCRQNRFLYWSLGRTTHTIWTLLVTCNRLQVLGPEGLKLCFLDIREITSLWSSLESRDNSAQSWKDPWAKWTGLPWSAEYYCFKSSWIPITKCHEGVILKELAAVSNVVFMLAYNEWMMIQDYATIQVQKITQIAHHL